MTWSWQSAAGSVMAHPGGQPGVESAGWHSRQQLLPFQRRCQGSSWPDQAPTPSCQLPAVTILCMHVMPEQLKCKRFSKSVLPSLAMLRPGCTGFGIYAAQRSEAQTAGDDCKHLWGSPDQYNMLTGPSWTGWAFAGLYLKRLTLLS